MVVAIQLVQHIMPVIRAFRKVIYGFDSLSI